MGGLDWALYLIWHRPCLSPALAGEARGSAPCSAEDCGPPSPWSWPVCYHIVCCHSSRPGTSPSCPRWSWCRRCSPSPRCPSRSPTPLWPWQAASRVSVWPSGGDWTLTVGWPEVTHFEAKFDVFGKISFNTLSLTESTWSASLGRNSHQISVSTWTRLFIVIVSIYANIINTKPVWSHAAHMISPAWPPAVTLSLPGHN